MKFFGFATAILITAGFLALAARSDQLAEGLRAIRAAEPSAWIAALTLMSAVAILRYLRLKAVFPSAAALGLFHAAALHGAANALMPAKLGEAALPIALKRFAGADLLAGAGVLALLRFFDAAALCALAATAGAAAGVFPPAAFAALPALFAAPLIARSAARLAREGESGLVLLRKLAQATAGITLARLYAMMGMTAAIWLALAAAAYAAARGVALDATFAQSGLAIAAASTTMVSPVNGVASAGPFEAAFAATLGVFGAPFAQGLAAAALVHAAAILAALAALIVGQALWLAAPLRAEAVR